MQETHDPNVVLKEGGGLMPLGGGEESGIYVFHLHLSHTMDVSFLPLQLAIRAMV